MKIWYAVSGRGQGNIFTSYPVRDEHFKIWLGCIQGNVCGLIHQLCVDSGFELPSITWKDEPVAIELSVKVINEQE